MTTKNVESDQSFPFKLSTASTLEKRIQLSRSWHDSMGTTLYRNRIDMEWKSWHLANDDTYFRFHAWLMFLLHSIRTEDTIKLMYKSIMKTLHLISFVSRPR